VTAEGSRVAEGRRQTLAFLGILLVTSAIAAGLAVMLSTDTLLVRAVQVSALVALGVQAVGFGCAKYLIGRKMNVFAAWGGAMAVRLISLVIYALLVMKAPQLGLALVAAPALMTFALLLVVTSIVEPLFLNPPETTTAA
jgi:hypothetical protein